MDEPIKLVEIDTDNVGEPRNDGSRGSALYAVPIKLSERPSAEWAEALVGHWDRPSSYTMSHRPGIARVSGDCVILDGTTIEEVKDVHLSTLKQAVTAANEETEKRQKLREIEAERSRERSEAHQAHVRDVAGNISFD